MSGLLGLRFALGTRDGLLRTLLVALATGLAVALLLLAVSVPAALAARDVRSAHRQPQLTDRPAAAQARYAGVSFTVAAGWVQGGLVAPRTAATPLPPGIGALPPDGAMLVSPALRRALAEDPALAARLPWRDAGLIGDAGLLGPGELAFLAVDRRIAASPDALGLTAWGAPNVHVQPFDPLIALLVAVGVVVLLLPIAVVVVLAGRFAAERRERRLAALRLVGLGQRQIAIVLAVEALIAGAAGAVLGVGLFLAGRQALRVLEIASLSVFPADAVPPVGLAAPVLVAVPLLVVLSALAGLRGLLVEPLGVVRRAPGRPRRLRWRVLPAAAGALLLLVGAERFAASRSDAAGVAPTAVGAALLLAGALAVLPWAVERVARAVGGGAVAWRLARGRLVHEGGTTARVVGAVAVVLAGAIALQVFLAGLVGVYRTGDAPSATTVALRVPQRDAGEALALGSGATVRIAATTVRGDRPVPLIVGGCAALTRIVPLDRCTAGRVFRTAGSSGARPDAVVSLGGTRWRVPSRLEDVPEGRDVDGSPVVGALLVPTGTVALTGSLPATAVATIPSTRPERVLERAVALDPALQLSVPATGPTTAHRFDAVRRGLTAGLVLVLLLVGGVLLVAVVDQLRERRAALAALAALGMPRRAMAASILLETALPVGVGVVVATGTGLVLGTVLLAVAARGPAIDPLVAVDVAAACAVPLLVAVAGLPFTARLMRPEGLRAE